MHPAGTQPGEEGEGRWVTDSFPVEPNPYGRWGREAKGTLAMWGKSEGTRPKAKEGREGLRLVVTVGEVGLARLRTGKGGTPGEPRWGQGTPPPMS